MLNPRDDGQQQFCFRSRAMRLRIDDDLMRPIDGRDAPIALDHACTRRHFRTLVVRAIALPYRTLGTPSFVRIRCQPSAHLVRVALQSLESLNGILRRRRLARRGVGRAMPLHHRARGRFQFGRLLFEIRARPTRLL
jgi:hypothetical protein